MDDDRRQLIGHIGDPVAVEAKDPWRILHRPEDGTGEHDRPEGVQAELELGDDPEVASAPTYAPEQVGVLGLAGPDEFAGRGDEIDRYELIDRQPVLPHEPADAAAEGEPRKARRGDDARGDGQAMRLRRAIEIAETNARLGTGRTRFGVDVDGVHQAEIDDDAVVAHRQAREAVTSTADGDRQARLVAERNGSDDVGHALAPRDEGRKSIDRAVPDLPMLVV